MKKEILIAKTDLAIMELVKEKTELKKAYNYYNCKRDPEQYRYLEENFGLGQPTLVEFIPLIRKHVDALIGEYLDIPIQPKISCKDKETINNIFRDKLLKIHTECVNLLKQNLSNNLLRFLGNKDLQDLNIKEQIDKLIEDINENFISEYEIAALNIVEYIIQSRSIDLLTKLKLLFTDLLVTGYFFFRAIPDKNNIKIECLNPLDTFPELNYNSPYVKDSHRVVIRKFLTRTEILNIYGNELSQKDIKLIKDEWSAEGRYSNNEVMLRYVKNPDGSPATSGLLAGQEVTPYEGDPIYYNQVLPVYEVEWLETDKDFVMLRYSTIRIGSDIYILRGKDENVVRSKDAPYKCSLTVNGVYFNNRGKEPYSMVLNCMTLQD